MSVSFPEWREVERFVRAETSAIESRRIVRQLLAAFGARVSRPEEWLAAMRRAEARCSPVSARAGRGPDPRSLDLLERAYDVALEKEQAPGLAGRLLALPRRERPAAVRRERAFHSWALCERLIDRCHDLTHAETMETAWAAEMADCALAVARELDSAYYGLGLVRDLQARAWAAVAEVLRLGADQRGCEGALARAEALLAEGTGDALEAGWVLELKAALRRDQRRPAEALGLLDEAVAIYRQYRDFHLVGRAFVQQGRTHAAAGDPEAAVHWLRKGLALVDPAREPRLERIARQGLLIALHESGRTEDARFLLKATRPDLSDLEGERLESERLDLRRRWLRRSAVAPAERRMECYRHGGGARG